ncbi:hypothetical protein ACFVYR_09020 [Streptomyces sp. NPDC058284]|uniref:hypothetical protein n=1 Tax=unclassified Streptomyces TaxID=2593676 RepID=UPI0036498916
MTSKRPEQVTGTDAVTAIKAERVPEAEVSASGAWWTAFFRASRIFNKRIDIPVVPGSLLFVSLTECSPGSNTPFLGDATVHTYNVVPFNGYMMLRGEVDWDEDLLLRASVYLA